MQKPKPEILEFFASAIPGTERALCDELRELGFKSVRLNRGGSPFRGPWSEGWRACLESRIAQRIQILLKRFPVSTQEVLYSELMTIDWSQFITPDHTISVSAVSVGSDLNHSGFITLKTKDAIVDQIRDVCGGRPSVDKDDPDVRVFLYLANNKAAVYLDLAGDPLHKRGYRRKPGHAPLRETLASAILRMSGWDRKTQLIDPMCGSGTIAIEAALWASNKAPGIDRERFGFERWANFGTEQEEAIRELRGKLRGAATGQHPKIQASDIDPEAIANTTQNARAAGVRISIKERSLTDLQPSQSGAIVVTNPPYGVRLEATPQLCSSVASVVSRLHGWRVCFLAGTTLYERTITTKPRFVTPLSNGDINCAFLVYDVE